MKKLLIFILLFSFSAQAQLSQVFKKHWFDGHAEITSYELIQSRYGEQRKGKAVLIFVTEDFLAKEQVKANKKSKTTVPVLKSNRTKRFLTGIYPYSIMNSTFSSLRKENALVKSVASIQEWCGQSYLQLNAEESQFSYVSHSYFEGEADEKHAFEKTFSEDEIWNTIRFDPNQLPVGNIQVLPSLENIRLNHIDPVAMEAVATLKSGEYQLYYPSTERHFTVYFSTAFPYSIEGWKEEYNIKGNQYTSTAKRIHTERRKYWQENNTAAESLRLPFKLK